MSLDLHPKTPSGGAAEADEAQRDPRVRLRARQAKLKKGSSRLFVLPGYDADNPEMDGVQLVARYNRLTDAEIREVLAPGQVEEDLTAANAQFLIEACDEILYRDKHGLHQPVEGHKTKFELNLESGESFGTLVGVDDQPSIRAQMVEGFGGNDLLLNSHSGDVHRWMVDANAADNEQALGEL